MKYRRGKPVRRRITALAATQGGYFTSRQAAQLGYERRRLAYHAAAGNFERVAQGLYRLPALPPSEHDDLVRATFWSRDRADVPQATVSHRTALSLHGLSDLFAGAVHLTVPPGFRKPAPRGWILHPGRLAPEEIEQREGFQVTSPLRTLLDVAGSDDVGYDELVEAVRDAMARGLVARRRLAPRAEEAKLDRLLHALKEAGAE